MGVGLQRRPAAKWVAAIATRATSCGSRKHRQTLDSYPRRCCSEVRTYERAHTNVLNRYLCTMGKNGFRQSRSFFIENESKRVKLQKWVFWSMSEWKSNNKIVVFKHFFNRLSSVENPGESLSCERAEHKVRLYQRFPCQYKGWVGEPASPSKVADNAGVSGQFGQKCRRSKSIIKICAGWRGRSHRSGRRSSLHGAALVWATNRRQKRHGIRQ